MIHEMNLASAPFRLMETGAKTIELRPYDEKRQAVSVGDMIIFTDLTDQRRKNNSANKGAQSLR